MKNLHKILTLLLCAAMLSMLMAGCGGTGPGPSATGDYQDTITIAPSLDFTGTDLQNNFGGTSKGVYILVFNTLIEKDTVTNELIPGLATAWDQISDSVWRFELREGVKFHDGSDFTAEDVKFTIERGKEQSSSKGKISSIANVNIISDYVVEFELDPLDNDIIYKLVDPNISILSATAFAGMSDEEANLIGTGPYRYGDWVQGDYLNLHRFDGYWGEPVNTENIVIRYIPEASSRLIALQTGEIDVCIDPPSIDLHYIDEDSSLSLVQFNSSTLRIVLLNTMVEPFDNPLVRQAVAHAINRSDYITGVYEGYAVACNNVMNPANPFYTDIDGYSYDLDKAKDLLAEAGYPDGFATTIFTSSGTVQKAVGSVLQSQLAKIGITADVSSLETATFNNLAVPGGTCPIIIDGWGGFTIGPDNALRSFFHSQGSYNESNNNDPELDRMIDEALVESDTVKRTAMYHELQEYATNIATMLPIAVEQINVGMQASVEGYLPPDGLLHHWRNICIPAR